jgi:hypothetical protein
MLLTNVLKRGLHREALVDKRIEMCADGLWGELDECCYFNVTNTGTSGRETWNIPQRDWTGPTNVRRSADGRRYRLV